MERYPGISWKVKVLNEASFIMQRNKRSRIVSPLLVPSESPWLHLENILSLWSLTLLPTSPSFSKIQRQAVGLNVYITVNSEKQPRCWLTDILVLGLGPGTRGGGSTSRFSENWGGGRKGGKDPAWWALSVSSKPEIFLHTCIHWKMTLV